MNVTSRLGLVLLSVALGSLGCFHAPAGNGSGSTGAASGSTGRGSGSTGSSSSGSSGTTGHVNGSTGSSGNVVATAISVTPVLATAAVGTDVVFVATATFSDGSTADVSRTAVWSSQTPSVASVVRGVASALSPGTARIDAKLGALTAEATLTVPASTVKSIAITPPSPSTGVSGSVQLAATATLTDNSTQDVTGSVAWTSASPSVATVSVSGLVTGVAVGSAGVSATLGTITASTTVTVVGATITSITVNPSQPTLAVGAHQAFTASAAYSNGSVADVTATATWTSSNLQALTIDAQGSSVAVGAGTSIVTASASGVSGSTAVTVNAPVLQRLVVSPASSTLALGGNVQLTATGGYSDGTTADLTSAVLWSSNASGVAAVSNASRNPGQVSAVSAGAATITATLSGVSGSATITVTAASLESIQVSPLTARAPRSAPVSFTAQGAYSDGSHVDLTAQVTWVSSMPSVATISNASASAGLATPVTAGTTTLSAQLGAISGTATLVVTAANLTSISLTPQGPSLIGGERLAMHATGNFDDGTTVDLTRQVAWTSGDNSVASVSNVSGAQGQIDALSAGSTTITATFNAGQPGAIAGTTQVTVTAPALSQLVVSPVRHAMPVGERFQLSAAAIDSNNTSTNVTLQATWTSSDPSVVTVGSGGRGSGVITSVAPGTATITASYSGLTAAAAVTVTAAVVTSIQVSPIQPSLPVGTRQRLLATAIFSDSTSQDVTGLATWLSSDANTVAVIPGPGRGGGGIDALQAGSAQVSASWMGLSGATRVTVTSAVPVSLSVYPGAVTLPAGGLRQLSAQIIYSDNTSRDVTGQSTWVSSSPQVAGVDSARNRGLVTAVGTGSTTITVSDLGLSATAQITVSGATVESINLTPIQPSVAVGTPIGFSAVAIYTDHTSQNVTGLATWTSSTPSVADVSDARGSKGQSQTFTAGTSSITASYQGVSGTAQLTVTAATLQVIQITPFNPTLPVGFVTRLQATGIYSDNTVQDLTGLATWTSGAPSIADVSTAGGTRGQLSPLAKGSTTITATYQGVTGTDGVQVTDATLQTISINPSNGSLAVGRAEQLTADGTFSDGSHLDVTSYVTWQSSATGVVNVSNAFGSQGRATAFGSGSATLTATRGAISGNTTVTVP
jgi:uncharacterized protein YjdB